MPLPAPARRAPARRIRALDGLRGLAALVVVLHHALLTLPPLAEPYRPGGARAEAGWAWLTYTPLHTLWQGQAAVYLFFILSGYVLTLPALRPGLCWAVYLPARLVRLYVPTTAALVWALVVFAAVPHEARTGASWWVNRHAFEVTPAGVARDSVLVLGADYLNSALWSLRWEVLFSLLLPAYVVLVRRAGRAWFVWLVVLLLLCAVGQLTQGHGRALFYLPIFAIGSVLAAQRQHVQASLAAWTDRLGPRAGAVGRLVVALGLVLVSSHWMLAGAGVADRGVRSAGVVAEVAGATLLVMAAIWSSTPRRLLEHPATQWLGSRSFSLYLVHEPLVVAVSMLLPVDAQGLTPVLSLPLALLAGELFFLAVERPSHRLSRTVARRLSDSPSGALTPVGAAREPQPVR